jgi:hypothetical protein
VKQRKIDPLSNIDIDNLDSELVRQPSRVQRIVKTLAQARLDHAEAKADLELVEAKVKKSIRKMPEKYGLAKPTEGAINEVLITQPEYQEAIRKVNQAKYDLDLLDGTLTVLEHKKRSLEGLVSLHGQGYFAAPRVKSGTPEGRRHAVRKSERRK